MKLTNASIKSLVSTVGKATLHFDDDKSGFGVRVTPGGIKSFVIRYRLGGRQGIQRTLTLGRVGILALEDARSLALRAKAGITQGIDPADTLRLAKQDAAAAARAGIDSRRASRARAFSALWPQYLAFLKANRRPNTVKSRVSIHKVHLAPAFGDRDIATITRLEMRRFLADRPDIPVTANSAVEIMRAFFRWAVEVGHLSEDHVNPAEKVKLNKTKSRERFLSADEFDRVSAALNHVETIGLSPTHADALRLIMLTGSRKMEIVDLEWSQVDLAHGRLTIEVGKTGRRVVQLSAPAREIIAHQPEQQGRVFKSCAGGERICLDRFWRKVRTIAQVPDVRIHDLRHSFASMAINNGVDLYTVGKLLGHTKPGTTAKYAHLQRGTLTQANEEVARHIVEAMEGKAVPGKLPTAEIIPMSVYPKLPKPIKWPRSTR